MSSNRIFKATNDPGDSEVWFDDIRNPHDADEWIRRVRLAKETGELDRASTVVKEFGTLELYAKDGSLKTVRYFDKITNLGKAMFAMNVGSRQSSSGSIPRFLGIGSLGSPVPAGSQHSLGSEIAINPRLYGSYTSPAGSNYFTLQRTYPAGTPRYTSGAVTTISVQEAGAVNRIGSSASYPGGSFSVFHGASRKGDYMNRGTFAVIHKGVNDTLKYSLKVTFT